MNTAIRNSELAKKIAEDIRKQYKTGKLNDKKIKAFLKEYYEGDPSTECPKGCKSDCMLECYIEIHQSLINDDGEKVDFKEPYIRDGEYYCCGKPMDTLENGNIYCSVCGGEYEK